MKFRQALIEDSKNIAEIHLVAFKRFFLTSLGIDFLRIYYESCINDASSVIICAVNDEGVIVGFASGTIHSQGYHKRIFLRNGVRFFLSLFSVCFSNPKAIIRLFKNLNKEPDSSKSIHSSELLSIAVMPELLGKGVGAQLLQLFEAETTSKGGTELVLTTDFDNNENVLSFYKRCGYAIDIDFFAYPRRHMYRMKKSLIVQN